MKKGRLLMAAALISAAMPLSAFAGQWKQNATGWWYDFGNGAYPANSWQWIDGNNDGIAECYYFNQYGYMLANTTQDGFQVDANGAWVKDGVVQTKNLSYHLGTSGGAGQENPESGDGSIIGTYVGYDAGGVGGKSGLTIEIYDDLGVLWANCSIYDLEEGEDGELIQLNRVKPQDDGSYVLEFDSWLEVPGNGWGYGVTSWEVEIEDGMMRGVIYGDDDSVIVCQKQ